MYDEIRRISNRNILQEGKGSMAENYFLCTVSKKKIIFPEFDRVCSVFVSCIERFPLAVQIIFPRRNKCCERYVNS